MVDDSFMLEAFVWERPINELVSKKTHWRENEIPMRIFIYGKYRMIRYNFVTRDWNRLQAHFVSAFEDDPDNLLPAVYIGFAS
jgi:hypothetical protein